MYDRSRITHFATPSFFFRSSAATAAKYAFALLSGKWKLEIMWLLNLRVYRFGELRKAIPGITQHMLTAQLRELEADGLVTRTVFAEVPPRVEYRLSPLGRSLSVLVIQIEDWVTANYGRMTGSVRRYDSDAA